MFLHFISKFTVFFLSFIATFAVTLLCIFSYKDIHFHFLIIFFLHSDEFILIKSLKNRIEILLVVIFRTVESFLYVVRILKVFVVVFFLLLSVRICFDCIRFMVKSVAAGLWF